MSVAPMESSEEAKEKTEPAMEKMLSKSRSLEVSLIIPDQSHIGI